MDEKKEKELLEKTKREVALTCPYLVWALKRQSGAEYTGSQVSVMSNGTLKKMIDVTCGYTLPNSLSGEVRFLLKYREPVTEDMPLSALLRRDSKGRLREFEYYKFLEGIPSLPRAYLIEEILKEKGIRPRDINDYVRGLEVLLNSVILELRGGQTLSKSLRETAVSETKGREKIIRSISEPLVDFQIAATRRSAGRLLSSDVSKSTFPERKMGVQIIDYVRGAAKMREVKEIPIERRREIVEHYAPTIFEYSHPVQIPLVCHGDLTPTNILVGNGTSFVDPQLKWRDSLIDMSSLLASPGVILDTNDEDIAIEFKVISASKTSGLIPTFKGRIPKLLRFGTRSCFVEDMQKGIRGAHNKLKLNYSLGSLAVINDLAESPGVYRGSPPQDTVEMRCNTADSLDRLINHTEELGLRQEDSDCYDKFREDLIDLGILTKEDIRLAGTSKVKRMFDAASKISEPARKERIA